MTLKKDSRNRVRFTDNGLRFEIRRRQDKTINITVYDRNFAGLGRETLVTNNDEIFANLTPTAASKLNRALATV